MASYPIDERMHEFTMVPGSTEVAVFEHVHEGGRCLVASSPSKLSLAGLWVMAQRHLELRH